MSCCAAAHVPRMQGKGLQLHTTGLTNLLPFCISLIISNIPSLADAPIENGLPSQLLRFCNNAVSLLEHFLSLLFNGFIVNKRISRSDETVVRILQ